MSDNLKTIREFAEELDCSYAINLQGRRKSVRKSSIRAVWDMKILTFSAIKGGVGKTTVAFNYGEWLAEHGNKVLFMDLDHQSNLSQTYNIYATENTGANIFSGQGQVDIHDVSAWIIRVIQSFLNINLS